MRIDLLSEYRPNAGQARFHRCRSAFKCGLAGIGGGKTSALCVESLLLSLANAGTDGLIVAPTWDMVINTTLESFRRVLPKGSDAGPSAVPSGPLVADWSATELTLRLANGSRIRFRSASRPDLLRGPNLAWFAMDEAALCGREAWDVLLGRVRVKAARRAAGIAVTTPRGFDWIYDEFAAPKPTHRISSNRALVRWSTADNAANLRPGFVEELRSAYSPRQARQELEAAFESAVGAVYADFLRKEVPFGNLLQWDPSTDRPTWLGLDFGFRRPAAVWLQAGRAPDEYVAIDEFAPEDCPVERFIAGIRSRPYRLTGAFGDPAGNGRHGNGDSDVRAFRAAGIDVRCCTDPSRTRLLAGIQLVQGLLLSAAGRRRLLLAVDGAGRARTPKLLAALESYRWPAAAPDRPPAEEPIKDGVHDHLTDALRYWAINHALPSSAGLTGRTFGR